MDLSRLSITELKQMEEVLRLIRRGSEILAELSKDRDVHIRMMPGECAVITTGWAMPQAGKIIDPDMVPVAIPQAATAELGITYRDTVAEEVSAEDAPLKVEPSVSPAPAPVIRDRQPRQSLKSPGTVAGPLTEAERAQILAGVKAGKSRAQIAAELNRRLQTVALFIDAWQRKAAQNEHLKASAVAPTSSPSRDAGSLTGGPDASDAPDTGQAPAATSTPKIDVAPIPAQPLMIDDQALVAEFHPSPFDPSDTRPSRQRQIARLLSQTRPRKGFDPELDLEIAEAIMRGERLGQIALDLGVDSNDLKFRWSDLTARLRDDKGTLAIDDQKFLLIELRAIVKKSRGAAA